MLRSPHPPAHPPTPARTHVRPEDERPLSTDPEASSSYGAFGSAAAILGPDEHREQQQQSTNEGQQPLGCGALAYVFVLSVVALSAVVALTGVVRSAPGSVSLETDASLPFTTTSEHPLRPGSLWGELKPPYPTGAWWLNLAIGDGDFPVAPLPYTMKATERGVGVSYSAMRRVVSLKRVQDTYATDLEVTAAEGVTGHHIVK